MSKFLGLFGEDEESNQQGQSQQNQQQNNSGNTTDSKNMVLHKEELDITKNMVQTGEVVLSKEIIEEQQTIDVPVMHEEIVIERTPLNNESTTSGISGEETIRIPVNEEQVDVNKRTVAVEEVSLYKNEVQENQQINETLQREDVSINTTGNASVVDNTGYMSNSNTANQGGDPNLGGNQGSWSDIQGENVDTSGNENYGGHQQLP
ncbi:MAG: hypothetical protein K0S34_254 [Bacillales bacterium]|jgi:uncharacterized protein (TIGR02271 family)|nr:hypothetical protein [Bacillales bacterium]